jgi:hypothetical protein
MTDHHDFGDHFDDDPPAYEDQAVPFPADDDPTGWPPHDDFSEISAQEAPAEAELPEPAAPEVVAAEWPADPVPDLSDPAVDVFPPAVDVGDLPEPVDGFPWIDSGSLGLADIAAALHEAGHDPVRPEELAGYAATDLPPGADPWAVLADSDDPATSALARWWSRGPA